MAGPERKRRWLWRVVIGFAVVLVVVVVAAPRIVASVIETQLANEVERRLGLEAHVDSISVSWSGELHVRDLRAVDANGATVGELAMLDGSVDVWNALGGSIEVDGQALGLQVFLRQREDGTWNLEDYLARFEATREPASTGSDRGGDSSGSSNLHATFRCEANAVLSTRSGKTSNVALNEATVTVEGEHVSGRGHGSVSDSDTRNGDFGFTFERSRAGAIDLQLDLAKVTLAIADPFLALNAPGRSHSGLLDGQVRASGTTAEFVTTSAIELTDLVVELPGDETRAPIVIREPRVEIGLDATVRPDTLDIPNAEFRIESALMSGTALVRATGLKAWSADGGAPARFEAIEAHLTYQPDTIGELFGPWLPVSVSKRLGASGSGTGSERIDVAFAGSMAAPDLESFLGGLDGTATIGIGRVATEMIDVEGDVALEFGEDASTWKATLHANGGELTLGGAFDRRALLDASGAPRTTLSLHALDIGATSRLSPLLSIVHPAFAAVESLDRSTVAGVIECDLDLAYTGPLTSDVLASGWDAFPTDKIEGKGTFALSSAHMQGAPDLQELLGYLGVDPNAEVKLRPIAFTIRAGRLMYDGDWTWTIGGVRTAFTGSVGLDHTLDLAWNIPVTAATVKKHGFLAALEGKDLRFPIRGTTKKPKLEWRATLQGLAKDTALGTVVKELGDELGLGDVKLDGSLGDAAKGALDDLVEQATKGGAKELLDEADRLWDADKKAEAAVIYRRIREEFKLSLEYALHRSKIKRRGDYEG